MELKEYIAHMHSLITDFENYWMENKNNKNLPAFQIQQLPLEMWDDQFEFFAELPTDE